MRTINEIILHCSATPEGKDFTVEDIRRWHLLRGFNDCGYHFVIYRDGSVHKGRPIEKVGAHCVKHNSKSIGISYIGGMDDKNIKPKDTRTPEQKESLFSLVNELMKKYNIPIENIHAHYEFANKACPSFDINTFKAELQNKIYY